MNWYYADAGQQAGPVDDAQLEELLRSGKIQGDTLVWREGMANWQPYSQVKSPAAPESTPSEPPAVQAVAGSAASREAVCVECGRIFNTDDMIRHGGNYVCASCKPIFMQKLSEGVSGSSRQRGAASQADLLARDYEVDIGGCLSHSWAVFKANAGIIIGASLLVYLCMIAINVIPYLNIVLAILLTGPLMGGLWFFYVKKVRHEEAVVGDAFRGFGPRFWQLVLAQLIPSLLAMAFVFMLGLIAALTIPAIVGPSRGSGGASGPMSTVLLLIFGGLAMVGVVVMIYFNMCWMFALPLVADKGLRFWPALELSRRVVSKHWWMTFWLMLVCGFVSLLGILACVVGVLVSGPVAFGTLATHYDRVFGDLAAGG